MQQSILDMCCGSRMFWFDKQDERAVFSDILYTDIKVVSFNMKKTLKLSTSSDRPT